MKKHLTIDDCISLIKQKGYDKVSRQTIYTWLMKYNLGTKIGGRWRKIDREKFVKFLNGEAGNDRKTAAQR